MVIIYTSLIQIINIIEIISGKLLNKKLLPCAIEHLLYDSRKLLFPKKSLFFAFKGERLDGHDFVRELYNKGLRNFIVSEEMEVSKFPLANFILVKNPLLALQQIAKAHRQQFSLKTIGITGSNGKTIVKEWLFQLLQEDFNIVRSPKSFNSQIGVPMSIWQIQDAHDLGIIEAGISQKGEMQNLAEIVDCEIGIFTNIGAAHSAGFSSLEEKLKEKLHLFKHTKTIIYCKDNELIDRAMQELPGKEFFTWSKTGKKANLNFSPDALEKSLPFKDDASIENALHCWTLMHYLNIDEKTIQDRISKLEKVAMRLELKEGINNCLVINDSYNSDLTSLSIALNFLEQQSKLPKRTLILSDILQSGQEPKQLYREVCNLLFEKQIDRLIGIGKEINILADILSSKNLKEFPKIEAIFYPNTAAFLNDFHQINFQKETILLKGARPFGFEKIATRLSKKNHQTTLEVNLNALIHNLRVYSSYLKPETKVIAMVKASAYGSGSVEVAKLLESQKVDYLGVAYADEGVELRKAGIQLPILVLNPEAATFDDLLEFQLEPEIYSLSQLDQFLNFLKTVTTSTVIHLKLDTGMHRLGFEEADLDDLLPLLKNTPQVKVRSIFSHLAASEAIPHDEFTNEQVDRFAKLSEKIIAALGYRPLRHILNSSGIIRFPQYQFEMVRLGIGLYGIDSTQELQEKLQVVNTLKASISQIKTIPKGETIGYGRSGKPNKISRIATISLGYADGLLRAAGNGAYQVLIEGQKAPIIGNVCMDMCMIDISHIPKAEVGAEVIIFGKELPVQELSTALHTIPYEVFTNISGRVKRVYFQE